MNVKPTINSPSWPNLVIVIYKALLVVGSVTLLYKNKNIFKAKKHAVETLKQIYNVKKDF